MPALISAGMKVVGNIYMKRSGIIICGKVGESVGIEVVGENVINCLHINIEIFLENLRISRHSDCDVWHCADTHDQTCKLQDETKGGRLQE